MSFISMISMAGIAIGVAVLIVVLSVMNGFERELRGRILSMTAHATITPFSAGLRDWHALADVARKHPEVAAVAPYIEGQAMLVAGKVTSGIQAYGVLPTEERNVSELHRQFIAGRLEDLLPGRYGIALGAELAKALNVQVGDRVVMIVPQATITVTGVMPRMRRFTVAGIFSAGMYEYDRNFAYLNLDDAARLYRMPDEVSGIRLHLQDMFAAPSVVRDIAVELGGGFYVNDWTHQKANFFRSIAITKRMLFFILLLVIAVAAFNIVSTLVMAVKDKRADIAILRTLGATPRSILKVFVTQGTGIGVLGTLAGIAFGVLLAVNLESLIHLIERVVGTQFLDAKVYFMRDLPAAVEWRDVAKIGGTAFGLCCLSTLYPAWRAARTQPAEALRHD